jgi:hypothetical protein
VDEAHPAQEARAEGKKVLLLEISLLYLDYYIIPEKGMEGVTFNKF